MEPKNKGTRIIPLPNRDDIKLFCTQTFANSTFERPWIPAIVLAHRKFQLERRNPNSSHSERTSIKEQWTPANERVHTEFLNGGIGHQKSTYSPRIKSEATATAQLPVNPPHQCHYARGRGCHIGIGGQGRMLRYSIRPPQRGYVRLGRTGLDWTDYYTHYDEYYFPLMVRQDANDYISALERSGIYKF